MNEPQRSHPVSGTSILLTGASGGLGTALARELDRRGAELTMVSLHEERLDAVPTEGHRMALDLRTPRACEAAVGGAVAHAGRLDGIVNAVGVVAFGPVAELTCDTTEELFLTNSFIPIFLANAAMGHLGRGGHITNISGVIAEQNLPGMAAYGASKAAVRSFSQALAREGRRAGIRVLDARPPHTETGLVNRSIEGTAPKMPEGLQPEHVARVICDGIESGATELASEAF